MERDDRLLRWRMVVVLREPLWESWVECHEIYDWESSWVIVLQLVCGPDVKTPRRKFEVRMSAPWIGTAGALSLSESERGRVNAPHGIALQIFQTGYSWAGRWGEGKEGDLSS